MCYLGENEKFSFYDGFCEQHPDIIIGSEYLCSFGRTIGSHFGRVCIACEKNSLNSPLYALCSGISDSGCDVLICSDTTLPALKHGISIMSCECGIFLSGDRNLKIFFYGKNGFPLSAKVLSRFINPCVTELSRKYGIISHINSLGRLYEYSIRDNLGTNILIEASVSCGSKSVRSLWLDFFSGEDENMILQVSDNGQRVNIYCTETGFISHDRLILAYAVMKGHRGEDVYLPESFHYIADSAAKKNGFCIIRFVPDSETDIPPEKVRFLKDPLFMCTQLLRDKTSFFELLSKLPSFYSAERTVTLSCSDCNIPRKVISDKNCIVSLSGNGRNTLSLTVQAEDMETAAELCVLWEKKLKKLDSCGRSFTL